jgi:hypothetical protein
MFSVAPSGAAKRCADVFRSSAGESYSSLVPKGKSNRRREKVGWKRSADIG